MSFSSEIAEQLREKASPPLSAPLPREALERLERLARFCPLYRTLIRRFPHYFPWLEAPANRDETFRFSAFKSIWEETAGKGPEEKKEVLEGLKRFRRRMSLRIAYREINNLASMEDSFRELTLLAEFCLREVIALASRHWEDRLGRPWDEENDQPARFCVIGLGKLGGEELNFCSDLDLLYLYEGSGFCRRGNRPARIGAEEYFVRLGREITALLQDRSEEGFLYNVDLRLRPEGKGGPLVRTLSGMENYYFSTGQTWERLALLKARPVAGNLSLGEELFEVLNAFRYPRHPPPSLLAEVAGLKLRTEKEVVGVENLERDIKSGRGGIREIEYYVQTLQLLNAGSNPFLQTHNTREAMERLYRYDLIDHRIKKTLLESYLFFRKVEHRLQMREEKQTHLLPPEGPLQEALAKSLQFETSAALRARLDAQRNAVRALYASLFKENFEEEKIQEWRLFLSGGEPGKRVRGKLNQWFGKTSRERESRLRNLVLGAPHNLLTRDHLLLFLEISKQFETVLKPLARPVRTLEKITRFAERYGARRQFFETCRLNPQLFHALSLLFDRGEFIYELLCRNPEILEEIFAEGLSRRKDRPGMEREMLRLPRGNDFPNWLWLYVKAEQVRLAASELLGAGTALEIEKALTLLGDAVLRVLLDRVDPEEELALVGLGKLGAGEMTFGSDLDVVFFSTRDSPRPALRKKVRDLLRMIAFRQPSGRIYEVDLRLRPHGKDGPLLATLPAFRKYHETSAQLWERQILTRARLVRGEARWAGQFFETRKKLLFERPLQAREVREIQRLRHIIEREKGGANPPQRAFKTGPGGLLDIEFITQILQMQYGKTFPRLQSGSTREVLHHAIKENLLEPCQGRILLDNYNFLRKIELHLRRSVNKAVSVLENDPKADRAIAIWLGFENFDAFQKDLIARMKKNRARFDCFMEKANKV